MAEWLCSGLQSRLRRFDSGFSLQVFMKSFILISGGFDPVHQGHLNLINDAAKIGKVAFFEPEILIVPLSFFPPTITNFCIN